MERCIEADEITVRSKSSANKTYTVSFKEAMPTCTCIAYAIGRNRSVSNKPNRKPWGQNPWCKHVEEILDRGVCRWEGDALFPGICPECGGRTVTCETARSIF
jgi:hypothetical protein